MRLLGTPTSPYVRKVRMVIHELGLADRIPFEAISLAENRDLSANPLRKVPTLLLDNGTAIYDSPVIMEWLDAELGGGRLLAASGPARWTALVAIATADGIMEAGGLVRTERLKPNEEDRVSAVIRRQSGKIEAALQRLDSDKAWRSAATPDLGQIAIGAAIAYLNFRLPDLAPTTAAHPGLAGWYAGFAQRPSVAATAPPPG
ncbi:MAG: glutathione S-transferase N-terminal domain-containing protein [Bauldia sp.]|nr:glutathione S-transferase N-terminal domain-containing protein [Bauldia sp.]